MVRCMRAMLVVLLQLCQGSLLVLYLGLLVVQLCFLLLQLVLLFFDVLILRVLVCQQLLHLVLLLG